MSGGGRLHRRAHSLPVLQTVVSGVAVAMTVAAAALHPDPRWVLFLLGVGCGMVMSAAYVGLDMIRHMRRMNAHSAALAAADAELRRIATFVKEGREVVIRRKDDAAEEPGERLH